MVDVVVAKFGGSSLADKDQFIKVKDIIESDKNRRYIIPSAPGKRHSRDHKITDLLYMCHQLATHGLNFDEVYNVVEERYTGICKGLNLNLNIEDNLREIKEEIKGGASRDYCGSRGEYLNGLMLSSYLGFEFIDPKNLILFNDRGQLEEEKTEMLIGEKLKDVKYAVIPGFYGAKENGDIVTFSRGGSDVTGSIIANGVKARLYENWTDVSGFLMADPRIVENPKPIEVITYKELRELSYMGAPVLHEESIFPVKKHGIPINIKNTNMPGDMGTMIVDDQSYVSTGSITGIAGKKDFTVITIEKTLRNEEKGFLRKVISVFETNNIDIEHIPSGIDSISVIVSNTRMNGKFEKIKEELRIYCNPDTITYDANMALIAVVGRGMIRTQGISAKVFTAMKEAGVNIRMITQGSSELNIIIGIENEDFDTAIESVYKAFEND
ncbi:MAG: aspartate kinase [Tissierellaceae bacterium]|nr:aspartate kinase [Tissierellaceae bacterium]